MGRVFFHGINSCMARKKKLVTQLQEVLRDGDELKKSRVLRLLDGGFFELTEEEVLEVKFPKPPKKSKASKSDEEKE